MKMNDLVQEVKAEIKHETKEKAKRILKERIREVQEIKKAAELSEQHLNKLLEMDVDDVV
jgi:hypothetical protein